MSAIGQRYAVARDLSLGNDGHPPPTAGTSFVSLAGPWARGPGYKGHQCKS